ncbi:MAG TPA: hypothetical protein VMF69_21630 [Gemmataceae bacterium]|nr:hypothetical protein [Gemmataceae bacterium]
MIRTDSVALKEDGLRRILSSQEKLINEPMQKTSSTRRHSGSARFLAMLGALLFIGISLYASREPATAVVDDDKSKTPTDRYVRLAWKTTRRSS